MAVLTYDLPIADGSTATEEPKIITALAQIKSVLDAGLDSGNISGSAGILLSQLEGGAAAQVPIVNTGGSLQYRAVTGDIHITQGGATSIQPGVVTNADLAGSIAGDKLAAGAALANLADGSITDAKLANFPGAPYRHLFTAHGRLSGGPTAQTWLLGSENASAQREMIASGQVISTGDIGPDVFRFSAGNFDIPGHTTQLLVRAQVDVNTNGGTNPGVNFLFNLFPYHTGGAANNMTYVINAALGNSAVITTPSATDTTAANSGDFPVTSSDDDQYLLGVTTSGTLATGSVVMVHAQVYVHNV